MFSLIMRWFDWDEAQGSMSLGRVFEYTEAPLVAQFSDNGQPAFDRLARLPCLSMNEGVGAEICRVGTITRSRVVNREALENSLIYASRLALDMPQDFEFSRNHWAVKDVDLYRMLLRTVRPSRQRPSLFRIEEHKRIEPELVSV